MAIGDQSCDCHSPCTLHHVFSHVTVILRTVFSHVTVIPLPSSLPQGQGVVCTLHEGDDFGKLSLLTEGERSVSIQTREPNCYFLKIERDDFRRILLSVESSTMKIMDRGKEVMYLQRESRGR